MLELRGAYEGSGWGWGWGVTEIFFEFDWQISLWECGLTTEIYGIVSHTVYNVFTNYSSLFFGPIIDHQERLIFAFSLPFYNKSNKRVKRTPLVIISGK